MRDLNRRLNRAQREVVSEPELPRGVEMLVRLLRLWTLRPAPGVDAETSSDCGELVARIERGEVTLTVPAVFEVMSTPMKEAIGVFIAEQRRLFDCQS